MDPLYGQRTTYTKKEQERNQWVVIDAAGKAPGRVATEVVRRLQGKHLPIYQPGIAIGDNVIIINAAKIKVTGNKLQQKEYHWHTGHPGGLKSRKMAIQLEKDPRKIFMIALKGMLAKTKHSRRLLGRVRVFPGAEHNLQAQKPVVLK